MGKCRYVNALDKLVRLIVFHLTILQLDDAISQMIVLIVMN